MLGLAEKLKKSPLGRGFDKCKVFERFVQKSLNLMLFFCFIYEGILRVIQQALL
jgi:hypothetical protein